MAFSLRFLCFWCGSFYGSLLSGACPLRYQCHRPQALKKLLSPQGLLAAGFQIWWGWIRMDQLFESWEVPEKSCDMQWTFDHNKSGFFDASWGCYSWLLDHPKILGRGLVVQASSKQSYQKAQHFLVQIYHVRSHAEFHSCRGQFFEVLLIHARSIQFFQYNKGMQDVSVCSEMYFALRIPSCRIRCIGSLLWAAQLACTSRSGANPSVCSVEDFCWEWLLFAAIRSRPFSGHSYKSGESKLIMVGCQGHTLQFSAPDTAHATGVTVALIAGGSTSSIHINVSRRTAELFLLFRAWAQLQVLRLVEGPRDWDVLLHRRDAPGVAGTE